MYTITAHTKRKARQLGVIVRRSTKKGKKIDVFHPKTGKLIVSVGALGYGDYPTFLRTYGRRYAEERRRAYKSRHRQNHGSAAWFADQLLW